MDSQLAIRAVAADQEPIASARESQTFCTLGSSVLNDQQSSL